MTTLANFEPLRPAAARLVEWLQAGNRRFFVLSQGVPAGPDDAVTLRATFLRYLSLGGCDACRLPETGLQVRCRYGAFQGNDAPTDAQSRLTWLALQQPKKYGQDFWPDPYEHCAKVLREMGHGADARAILIEKERLQRKARRDRIARDLAQARHDRDTTPMKDGLRLHTDRVIGHWLHLTGLRVWDAILGAVVGYGRKPQNAAWWGLAMLIIGILVFGNAAGHGAIKPNLPQISLTRLGSLAPMTRAGSWTVSSTIPTRPLTRVSTPSSIPPIR